MSKNNSRKGIALGAVFALLTSLFAAVPAAQGALTASSPDLIVAPLEGSSDTMVITEEFALTHALGNSVSDDKKSRVKIFVEKPVGYGVTFSTTVSAVADLTQTSSGITSSSVTFTQTISSVVTPGTSVTGVNQIILSVYTSSQALTSVSPGVDVSVTVFIDDNPDGKLDRVNESYETYVVKFRPWSALTPVVSLTAPKEGDVWATASATIAGVNSEQLNGSLQLYFVSTADGGSLVAYDAGSSSGAVNPVQMAAGDFSHSEAIASATQDASVSAIVVYNGTAATDIIKIAKLGVTGKTIEGITFSAVASANIAKDTATEADVRVNSAFSFEVWPYSGSKTASVAVVPSMTMDSIGSLSNEKYIVIEGVKYTQSSKLPTVSALTLPAGKSSIDVSTYGFDGNETSTVMTFTAQNETATYTLDWQGASYSLENGPTAASTKPGSAVSMTWDVEDQWGIASTNPNHEVVVFFKGDSKFSSSASVSFAVSGAKSTVTLTPSPATATGSTTVAVSLRTKNLTNGLWSIDETEEITLVVSALSGGFTSSAVATTSASISYAVADGAFSWSSALSGTAAVGGQSVVISSPDLYFKSSTGVTASGTLTVNAGTDGAFSFFAASAKAGKHVITMTAGGGTTTSELVVSPATHDSGKTITVDVTEIMAGTTTTITGTLTDANGNPVNTGATASLKVTWTGKGLAFNLPTTTDADGEFSFQVLALTADVGESAMSVTYMPTGSTTYTKNITVAKAVDIVSSLTSATEQKITVGTFKGYVAIYTKGYMGQKLSAKVAGKWLVVDPIAAYKSNDYSRTVRLTGAGYTITVDLYMDGAFVRSEVVTTK